MTNRKDMIDEALLRPGRLEVHVEISLPDEGGRLQILKIHTAKMSEAGIVVVVAAGNEDADDADLANDDTFGDLPAIVPGEDDFDFNQIGRASCRERV